MDSALRLQAEQIARDEDRSLAQIARAGLRRELEDAKTSIVITRGNDDAA